MIVLNVIKPKGSRAGSGRFVAVESRLRLAVGQSFPEYFELLVEFIGHARSAAARSIVCDFDVRRMLDDTALVELRKLDRYAANEVPGAMTAGEKIGHRKQVSG